MNEPTTNNEIVGGESLRLTGLDAIERYKLIVGDLEPAIYKAHKAETSTVAWRCLALNVISKAKHDRNKLKVALQQADEELYAPTPNCSCHINPPCSDCVEYAGIREVKAVIYNLLVNNP